ncbi:caspase family protein [Actibacterium sp. 188UL27-1]|uniref:caspase family protein n=1 Tax=Actibacterium sp. 188UL27-1 TaxID=2786961 RepID=UPI0019579881|nr:caspase family protein [Actibacterium sp. 188UL27-1]MBM7067248.1 caspase family protein [Actibacterium sp. 188UL27-1]
MGVFRQIVFAQLFLALMVVGAWAQATGKRVAFVVGNSAYEGVLPSLKNPVNDATDIAARLDELGFTVILATDLDRVGFQTALLQFAQALDGAETSLFFYAGHGIQVSDENHIIPVDARVSRGIDFANETVTVNRIVGLMNQFTETSIVLLDACRDNPLTSDIPVGQQQDGFGRGLARVRASGGSYIAFATAPGNVAYDGLGRNSPFTEALLNHIDTPNVDIRLMMADVRQDVFRTTGQRQLPWENNSLIGRFYFNQDDRLQRLDSAQRSETEAWQLISNSIRREDYAGFLRDFPDGTFAQLAELKITALEQVDALANRERTDFVLARSTNSERGWSEFIEAYPGGIFAEIAGEELQELQDDIARNQMTLEEIHWQSIATSRAPSDFRTFLAIYPQGRFSDLAAQRLDATERAEEIAQSLTGQSAEDVTDAELEREVKRRVAQIPVQFVQYGLNALGHQVSDISGVLDPPTRRAIRNYQATIDAPQTGRLAPEQTVDLLMSAAALGDSNALTAAGIMLSAGHGLRQNEAMAREWLDRAADKGNGLAMANLGILYRDGRGGARDMEKARSLLTVAVTLGVDGAEPVLRSLGQ